MAKVGDSCIVAWSFDQTPRLNISSGVVQATQKRGTKRKLAIKYTGIHGYKVEESFSGHIPPQSNVRIYKLIWDSGNIESSTAAPTQTICISTDSDLDHELMPTLRTVSPEFIPCAVAIYRELLRDYAESTYPERNCIWHKVLSATKYSLATVRNASAKRGRRDQIKTLENGSSGTEGCATAVPDKLDFLL